jgi:acyl-coenzyme A synthetase/AMP-(fatty) acid ligase
MIKNQGYRLSPEEVENLLLGSGLVHEACAFGVENPAVGHDVIAVISLKNGGEDGAIDSIREYAINNGPPYMIPKEIIVRDELPKNANGKIDRKGISSAYTNG